jgi:hypothetical protein
MLKELKKTNLPIDMIRKVSSYAGCPDPKNCIYIHNQELLKLDLCIDGDDEDKGILLLDTNIGTFQFSSIKVEESVEIITHNNCTCVRIVNFSHGKKVYQYNNTQNSWECLICSPREI